MTEQRLSISVDATRSVSALWTGAATAGPAFVYAPGAGAGLDDGFGRYAATALADAGIAMLRFQFPYREAGKSLPVLEATWRAALATAGERAPWLVAGGRSMGGRMASHVVAQGAAVAGLALFAYPLHPPKRPQQRRDAHLPAIDCPTLLCSGDRDTFATVAELQALLSVLPDARLYVLHGADHGFNVLKASGRRREDIWHEAATTLIEFIRRLS